MLAKRNSDITTLPPKRFDPAEAEQILKGFYPDIERAKVEIQLKDWEKKHVSVHNNG